MATSEEGDSFGGVKLCQKLLHNLGSKIEIKWKKGRWREVDEKITRLAKTTKWRSNFGSKESGLNDRKLNQLQVGKGSAIVQFSSE